MTCFFAWFVSFFFAWFVREHVLKLEAVARKEYYGDDPDASPYCTAPE